MVFNLVYILFQFDSELTRLRQFGISVINFKALLGKILTHTKIFNARAI